MASRYVDNRLTLSIGDSVPSGLLRPDFYEAPVVLEDEPDLAHLGTMVYTDNGDVQVEYTVVGFDCLTQDLFDDERWRYRSILSGGSVTAQMAGMQARLHQAARFSFPVERATRAVNRLWAIGVHMQYNKQALISTLTKHAAKYPVVYKQIADQIRVAVTAGGHRGVSHLVGLDAILSDKVGSN